MNTNSPKNRAQAVEALEDRRQEAMLNGDVETLRNLMHPACVYAHSSGTVQDGATYLASLEADGSRYVGLVAENRKVTSIGAVNVVAYRQQSQVRFGEELHSMEAQCLAVWSDDGSGPRLVAFQSARLS